jgi:hypothetical protein
MTPAPNYFNLKPLSLKLFAQGLCVTAVQRKAKRGYDVGISKIFATVGWQPPADQGGYFVP